jgi:hypothetical protein
MDIRVIEEEGRRTFEIEIFCAPGDKRVPRIERHLRAAAGVIVGYESPGSITKRVVSLDDLLVVSTEGGNALLHLADGTVLESPMRLLELEEALDGTEFVRTSRQEIVNFDRVKKIRPESSGRLMLELDGGSRVLVSRSYAPIIKGILGIGKAKKRRQAM